MSGQPTNATPKPGAGQDPARVSAGLALIDAAEDGALWIVHELLPKADLSMTNLSGQNALQAAVRFKMARCASALLPHFDAKAKNGRGRTLLMEAAADGWAEGVKLLLPASDANDVDEGGWTALFHAVETNVAWTDPARKDILEALLSACDPNVADQHGMTALMIAASVGDKEAVEIRAPVSNPRATDKQGETALDHATKRSRFWVDSSSAGLIEILRKEMQIAERAEIRQEVASADADATASAPRRAPRAL